jgi:hypothetical protein
MMQISNIERLMAEQYSLDSSLTRENTPTPPDLVIHAEVQADVVMDETTTELEPKNSSTDAMGVRLLQLSGTRAYVCVCVYIYIYGPNVACAYHPSSDRIFVHSFHF